MLTGIAMAGCIYDIHRPAYLASKLTVFCYFKGLKVTHRCQLTVHFCSSLGQIWTGQPVGIQPSRLVIGLYSLQSISKVSCISQIWLRVDAALSEKASQLVFSDNFYPPLQL